MYSDLAHFDIKAFFDNELYDAFAGQASRAGYSAMTLNRWESCDSCKRGDAILQSLECKHLGTSGNICHICECFL